MAKVAAKRVAPPESQTFGSLVKMFRTQAGLTQQDVADRAEVSTQYIGLIEGGHRGQRVSRDLAKRFAMALDLNLVQTEMLFRASGHLGQDESLVNGAGDGTSLINMIEADQTLTDSHKRLIINLYTTLSRPRR